MADETVFLTLEDAKNYMRVEHSEENDLIETLISAAEEDVKSYLNEDDLSKVKNPEMVKLAAKYLVSHWYENRSVASTGNTIPREMPSTVTRLLYRERNVPL